MVRLAPDRSPQGNGTRCSRSTSHGLATASVLCVLLCSPAAHAGFNCQNLDAYPPVDNVDFEAHIQPVFNGSCAICHGPSHQTGPDLTPGASYAELVDVPSSQNAAWTRVVPFDLDASLLFLKINCADPPVGNAMPPGTTIFPVNQALIRDWINQGALPQSVGDALFRDRFEAP